jgi:ubiquinone/menaquinone biosynthesis C-methylase UbiE
MIYTGFASVYDRLMQDAPYEGWINYLGQLFTKHSICPGNILDIGCGTGNITIPLAKMGYSLTGLDMSAEMLAVAEEKARTAGLKINWLCQDMRQMDLGGQKYDLVISMTDSLNYIRTAEELQEVFSRVKGLLKPEGWFIFDLNSAYKIGEVFGNNVFTFLEDDIAYIWENKYNFKTRICIMELTFFAREDDDRYRRFAETHTETAFETEEITKMLENTDFSVSAVYGENTFKKPSAKTERIYFVARTDKV